MIQNHAASDNRGLAQQPATAGEIIALSDRLMSLMDSLSQVIADETQLIRAGKLADAAQLEPSKSELARHYMLDALRFKPNRSLLAQAAPDRLDAIQDKHDSFRAVLQMNLTVLATAHAVSEGIVRGVSGELGRQAAPQTYGASGQSNAARNTAQPLAVSRVL